MIKCTNIKNYYPQLDGLRGLAALTVFFSHVMGFFALSPLITYLQESPLRTFWDGAAAVDLFFVLSGFVLTLPFMSGDKKINYFHYVIRRLFRIYPAYWLALAICLTLRYFYSPLNIIDLSAWSQSFWTSQEPITLKLIASHLTLMLLIQGVFYQAFLVMFTYIFVAFTGYIAAFPLFALGAYLASNLNTFSRVFLKLSKIHLLGLVIIIFCLYGNRWILPFHLYESFLTGIASFLIILIIINHNILKTILQTKMFIFLGKTSYSFYLLNLPILLVITSIIYPMTHSVLICALITLIVSYGLAYIIYLGLELPAISFGRRLTMSKKFALVNNKC